MKFPIQLENMKLNTIILMSFELFFLKKSRILFFLMTNKQIKS